MNRDARFPERRVGVLRTATAHDTPASLGVAGRWSVSAFPPNPESRVPNPESRVPNPDTYLIQPLSLACTTATRCM